MKFKRGGYTFVELMVVVVIVGILASMVGPRMQLVVQKAHQAKTRSNLGTIRSALNLYYADNEGHFPFLFEPDGVASATGKSFTPQIVPQYLGRMPVPYLNDPYHVFPGVFYDNEAKINMSYNPPRDVVFVNGPVGFVAVNRPFVYDPSTGHIYICSGNYSTAYEFFYSW